MDNNMFKDLFVNVIRLIYNIFFFLKNLSFWLINFFCCERGNRTLDLKVMSLASYRCYYLAMCGDEESRTPVSVMNNNTNVSHA
jgi:hypothetical protein